VVVLRKFDQRIDRHGGVFSGLDHHTGDKPAIRTRRVGSVVIRSQAGRERSPAMLEGFSVDRQGLKRVDFPVLRAQPLRLP